MCKTRRSSKTLPVYLHLKFPVSRPRGLWRPAAQGEPGVGRHSILCLAFTEAFACAAVGRGPAIPLVTIGPFVPILQSQAGPSRFISPYITSSTSTEDPRTVSCPPMCSSSRRQARPDALHVPGVGCCGLHRADLAYCRGRSGGMHHGSAVSRQEAFPFVPRFLCAETCPQSLSAPSLLPQMNTNHIQIKRLETKCGLLSSTYVCKRTGYTAIYTSVILVMWAGSWGQFLSRIP